MTRVFIERVVARGVGAQNRHKLKPELDDFTCFSFYKFNAVTSDGLTKQYSLGICIVHFIS